MSKPFVPRYSRVASNFWTDKIYSTWTDQVKLASLYVTTCSHRHLEGIYTLPPEYACADLRWTSHSWKRALTVLETSNFVRWDPRTNILLIVDALRYQAPENDNQSDGAIRRIMDLPESPLIKEFCAIAWDHCNRKGASRAFKLFVEKLLKQTGTQLHEQTHSLLPEQPPTPLVEQGHPLNLIPPTVAKPLSISSERPTGNPEKERKVASMGDGKRRKLDDDQIEPMGNPLEYMSPSLRETFAPHVEVRS